MHRGGFQGGPPQKGYSDGYGQGQQGKKSWRQQPQPQYYGQQPDEGYYGHDQYEVDPREATYGDYQDQYYDPYYSRDDQGVWDQEYPDDHGSYYPSQRSYHQGGDYHHSKRQQGAKHQPHQKPQGKPYPAHPQKKYPQEQSNYRKGGYSSPNLYPQQNPVKDKQNGQRKQQKQTHKESMEEMELSSKKEPSIQEIHEVKTGGQGATKPAYGHYYTQKKFLEQEQLKKQKEHSQSQTPVDSSASIQQISANDQSPGKIQIGSLTTALKSSTDQTISKEIVSNTGPQNDTEDERFSKTMARFNTLDRGTYFVKEDNKKAHFLVAGRADLLGWRDTYVINGYLLHGVVIKILTLTSRIFLFIENLHSLYSKFFEFAEDGETVRWTKEMPDKVQIVTVTNIEKVEILDNDEDGFEGFVCYTICEDSKIEFAHTSEDVDDWHYVQELILLYEPTSIRKIYLDVVYNSIYKPESKGFGGKRIAAIVNPHVPGETIQYKKEIVTALDISCVVGTIWVQNGRYTLIAETIEDMERLVKLIDLALDIAEELNAYVMITNLRRTFDFVGKTVLYISSDPTLKLIRSSNSISFANKIKKSENLT